MTEPDRWPAGSEEFRSFLRDRERSLVARAREGGLFAHKATSGVARERVLHEPLHELLPARYGLTSGVIKDSSGATSGQWDILIYDAIDAPVLYRSVEAAVLPIESVLAGISVKTTIDKTAVFEAAAAAGQLREMDRRYVGSSTPHKAKPDVFLFGFGGSTLETLRGHVHEACEHPASSKVLSGVAALGAGLILPISGDGRLDIANEVQRYDVAYSADGTFGIFIGVLWSALARAHSRAPNLLSYLRMGDLLDPEHRSADYQDRGNGEP